MSIVSATLITKAADYAVKLGMELYVKWHFGGSHERAEQYRARLKRIDEARKQKEMAK